MLDVRSATRPDPAAIDRAEADALDGMAAHLTRFAQVVTALAEASRTLAVALRCQGSARCDAPRLSFVMATADFLAGWRVTRQSIEVARDATRVGLYDD